MTNKNYKTHEICMYAAFIFGIGAIIFPQKNADKTNVIAFLISAAFSVLLLFAFNTLLKSTFKNANNKILNAVFFILVIIIALYVATNSAKIYTDFVSNRMLPFSSRWAIAFIFLTVCAVLSACDMRVLLKFSLLTLVFSLLIVSVMFALSYKDFNLENISVLGFPDFKKTLMQSLSYLESLILPIFLMPIIKQSISPEDKNESLYLGCILGLLMLVTVILNSLLIFGVNTAGKMQYPYCDALSTVTLSKLFTRMDGFSYFLYFSGALIRTSLGIEVVKFLLREMGFKCLKSAVAVICTAVFLICIF